MAKFIAAKEEGMFLGNSAVYQILLIAIGTLFGQFDFFSNFTKNTFRKTFLKLINKIFFK